MARRGNEPLRPGPAGVSSAWEQRDDTAVQKPHLKHTPPHQRAFSQRFKSAPAEHGERGLRLVDLERVPGADKNSNMSWVTSAQFPLMSGDRLHRVIRGRQHDRRRTGCTRLFRSGTVSSPGVDQPLADLRNCWRPKVYASRERTAGFRQVGAKLDGASAAAGARPRRRRRGRRQLKSRRKGESTGRKQESLACNNLAVPGLAGGLEESTRLYLRAVLAAGVPGRRAGARAGRPRRNYRRASAKLDPAAADRRQRRRRVLASELQLKEAGVRLRAESSGP